MKKQLISGALALTILTSTSAMAVASFDDTENHWSAEYVDFCTELGLINGISDSIFQPDEKLTVAQGAAIAARFHVYMTESVDLVETDVWHEVYIGYFEDLGYKFTSNLDTEITRQEFFDLLALVMPEKYLGAINEIEEIPDTDDESVLAFYKAGILTGSDAYGTFNGHTSLTRAESSAIMARCADESLRIEFTPKEIDDSIAAEYLFINDEDTAVTISGYDVTADAYIAILSAELERISAEYQLSFHPEYEDVYKLWLTSDFPHGFERYLSEVYAENSYTPIDWAEFNEYLNAFPYELAKENVNEYLTYHAAIRSYAQEFELYLDDKDVKAIENELDELNIKDDIRELYKKITLEDEYLYNLLIDELEPTEPAIDRMLATNDYVCADYLSFEKSELSEAELTLLREGMTVLKAELTELPIYVKFEETAKALEVPYSGLRPTIYEKDSTSAALFDTLIALKPAGVSAIIETEDSISLHFVMLGLDHELTSKVQKNYAIDLLEAEINRFSVNPTITNSAAVNNLNVLEFAKKLN